MVGGAARSRLIAPAGVASCLMRLAAAAAAVCTASRVLHSALYQAVRAAARQEELLQAIAAVLAPHQTVRAAVMVECKLRLPLPLLAPGTAPSGACRAQAFEAGGRPWLKAAEHRALLPMAQPGLTPSQAVLAPTKQLHYTQWGGALCIRIGGEALHLVQGDTAGQGTEVSTCVQGTGWGAALLYRLPYCSLDDCLMLHRPAPTTPLYTLTKPSQRAHSPNSAYSSRRALR